MSSFGRATSAGIEMPNPPNNSFNIFMHSLLHVPLYPLHVPFPPLTSCLLNIGQLAWKLLSYQRFMRFHLLALTLTAPSPLPLPSFPFDNSGMHPRTSIYCSVWLTSGFCCSWLAATTGVGSARAFLMGLSMRDSTTARKSSMSTSRSTVGNA